LGTWKARVCTCAAQLVASGREVPPPPPLVAAVALCSAHTTGRHAPRAAVKPRAPAASSSREGAYGILRSAP
jgi:hypothetical protein